MNIRRISPIALIVGMTTSSLGLAQTEQAGITEEVLVTGFRRSLEVALDNKRDSANNVESIVAEDIGKMPDLNLAESVQRVPGVAITREGGEGRQVSVRGLGPDFTRSTLNGMEVPGSAGGLDSSGGVNRGRAIDFNIFASEIFNRIDIHKSPRASIEEGGLASTIELYTAKPFDNPGFHATVSAQGTVENLSDELDPRFTALISNTFMDDTLGVLVSVATSERTVIQEGFGSVRWSSPNTNGGRSWADTSTTVINGNLNAEANGWDPDGTDDPLDYVWGPRLPRMDLFTNDQTRTGFTAVLQYRPSERLELGLDIVGSKLENDRNSYNYFAQFRNVWGNITPVSLTLDNSGRYLVAGEFSGVSPRSESRGQFSETDFLQTVLSGSYDLSDRTIVKVLLGTVNSKHDEEQYRFNLTAAPSTFTFDFGADPNIAEMSYGFDIMDPDFYSFSGPVIRKDVVDRDNTTLRVDLESEGDSSSVKVGLIYNEREVDSLRYDPTEGTLTPPADVTDELTRGIPADDFGSNIGAPAGFPRDWLVADFNATIAAYNAGDFTAVPLDAASWNIKEETAGAYVEFDVNTELLNLPLRINAGVRVVQTDTTATAAAVTVNSDGSPGDPVVFSEDASYTDVLPSTNIVWELREDLLLRTNIARNLTRPGLSSLAPTTTNIGTLQGTISTGNPDLDPMRANSFDLSLEWYFNEESLLAATFFRKDIESFINGSLTTGTLSPELLAIVAARPEYDPSSPVYEPSSTPPDSSDWEISRPVNADGATLEGIELAYQQPFDFLPAPFNHLGVIANYNHVYSRLVQGEFDSALSGLSKNSYNFTLYYETGTYGGRVAVNGRDDYISDVPGGDGNAEAATTGPTRVDMSAFYDITDNITVTLEAINVTNEEERLYTTGPTGDLNLVREYNTTGREILLGVRASF